MHSELVILFGFGVGLTLQLVAAALMFTGVAMLARHLFLETSERDRLVTATRAAEPAPQAS